MVGEGFVPELQKLLEDNLPVLYRVRDKLDGTARQDLEHTIHDYKVLYYRITGNQYHPPHMPHPELDFCEVRLPLKIKPKPTILPKHI